MTTPISSSSSAGLQGSPLSLAATGNASSANSASKTRASQSSAPSDTAMSSPDVATLSAASGISQLQLAFAQAMQNATSVDPTTGQNELSTSANSQLSAALSSFLVQSGFSQQQAQAASSSFAAQLAQGGPVDLSASFSESVTTSSSASASYGSMTMSESSVSVNARSGTVSIEFDPTSGDLSISLGEVQTSATQTITETNAPGQMLSLPVQGQDSNADENGALNDQSGGASANDSAASSNANDGLQQLLAGLGMPELLGVQDALNALSLMVKAAQSGSASGNAASGSGATSQAAQNQSSAAPSAATPSAATIGFTQPLSIAMHDPKGHGTTLFNRPDGTTGAMSFEPTNVQA